MKNHKTKTKCFVLTLLLLVVVFCFSGCAEINFVTYHNEDGSIVEYVHLNIDEQALIEYGESPEQIKLEIPADCYAQAKQLLEQYQLKLIGQYNNKLLSSDEYQQYYDGIKIVQQNYINGEYVIGLEYSNSTVYKKYYELLNGSTFDSKPKVEKKLFYTKTYYYGTANYGDYTIFGTIYNYYTGSRFAHISPQEAKLTYSYSVSSRRFHSDANQTQLDSNGNYIHTWNIDPAEPSRPICLYTISANRSVWIIACIGIGLASLLPLTIIALIKLHKQKHLMLDQMLDNDKNLNNNIDNN